MNRAIRTLSGLVVALNLAVHGFAARAAERVDLLLVLASDVSRSVDSQKFQLQRDGYVAALNKPRVIEAIRSGGTGHIAVCFVEWSGVTSQKLVIDWTSIGDAEGARRFSDALVEAPRSFADRTSISAGIDFAMTQLEHAPFEANRRTIDVSGDGTNNAPLAWNPEHTNPPGGLAEYYRRNVIGGPSAFVMVAENHGSFGQAILNKLVAEIARGSPPRHAALSWARPLRRD